ncbi:MULTISPECIES: hypothetical protein [Moorena]|uniref:hypothetical protein n=1 Tax=Moorena TaxID=1155738 RepID=UPI0014298C00|nr:hypothetical protein [Moorena sp. SIO4G3]NEO79711.1 hypothetical protein [Moorena sp. SIO4G3]
MRLAVGHATRTLSSDRDIGSINAIGLGQKATLREWPRYAIAPDSRLPIPDSRFPTPKPDVKNLPL